MANSGNTFLALLTGAAVGAAVGLLYAPDSGENTRVKLSKDAKKAQDEFNKRYKETSSNLTTKAKKAKIDFEARLEETLSSASFKADEILTALESKLEDLRKQNAKFQKEGKESSASSIASNNTSGNSAGTSTGNKAVI